MQLSEKNTLERVVAEQNGQHVSFDNDFMQRFGDLTVPRIMNPNDGGPIGRTKQSLLTDDRGFRIPNAGCLPVIEHMLRNHGFELQVNNSPRIIELPHPTNTNSLAYPSLARFACLHKNGIIESPKPLHAKVIADLAQADRNRRLVVLGMGVASLEKAAKQTKTQLPCAMRDEVVVVHGKQPLHVVDDEPLPRIIFSTFISAADCDFESSDIVLLLEAKQVTQSRCRMALEAIDARFRLFGIVDTGAPASPLESGVMMGTFGPQKISLLSDGRFRREVYVDIIEHRQPSLCLTPDSADFLRKAYWHNERRNREIVRFAKTLIAGDPMDRSFRPSVTILVKHLDHAASLARRLSGWKVHISTDDRYAVSQMPRTFRDQVESDSKSWSTGQNQIVLANAANDFSGYLSRAIIWAGGGTTDEIPEFWLYRREGDNHRRTLIIDFADPFNKTTRRWSQDRNRVYNTKDIFPIGVSAVEGRIKAFLDGQKEVTHV